jgi:capsular polysaccharide biosynthesis protein
VVDAATRLGDRPGVDIDVLDSPGGPLIRVSTLLAALRRRRRVWVGAALAGLLAATAFFVLRGPQYSADTTLLIRRTTINPEDPAQAMDTDIQLAQSRTVAGRALNQLQLHEPLATFQSSYKVTSLTNDVIEFSANASTSNGAVRIANTLANAYVGFLAQSVQRETQVEIAAMQQEANTLQAEVGPLDTQITTATIEVGNSTSSATASTLGDLLAERSQVEGQIDTVQQQISNVTADSAAVVQNTRVVDPALASHRSLLKNLIIDIPAGLLGGAALGAGWVMFTEAVSTRVRRREDVMMALDAPVAVSVGSVTPPRRLHWPRSSAATGSSGPASPRREVAKMARHLREVLATAHSATPDLAVVSVASDDEAALAAASMVQGLLGEGSDVLVVDLSATSALARRFGVAPNAVSQVAHTGLDAKLWVVSRSLAEGSSIDDWLQLHNLRDETEAVVVLASLDPAEGAGHLAALATTAVAVVTSGRSTAATLRATSQMLRAAGLRLDSAVLVGADPTDESYGVPAPVTAQPPSWA